MQLRLLDRSWTVTPVVDHPFHRPYYGAVPTVPAQVPGHVHTDLVAAGVIGDPFVGMLEFGARWVDETDWVFGCEFEWQPSEGLPLRVLRFEGLDTVATVLLNGEEIGRSDNFFLPLELDVTGKLIPGINRLQVKLESAVRVGMERRAKYLAEQGLPTETAWFDEHAFVRKPGYMSGWDWGPRIVSCGIWAPVVLLEYASRINHVSVLSEHLGRERFRVWIDAECEGAGELSATWDDQPFGPDLSLEVVSNTWWPNGEGEPYLHRATITFGDHTVERKVGLRTVKLLRIPDKDGTSFEFEVNGRRIWSRGFNWIPHDSFPSRITPTEVEAAVARYAKLGANMLRVWGGGMYETEAFYDACDRHGIMVWQDFPYACSYTPDDEPAQQVARSEADFHIRRLRDRASHVLWCGNNENRSLYYGRWSGTGILPSRFYGEKLYDDTLKKAVESGDPAKAYVESSPLLVNGLPGANCPTVHSDDHYWDVWHGRGDWVHYRDSDTRFSSEFGFASSCGWRAWNRVGNNLSSPEQPAVRWHDKTGKPWDVFRGLVELHYPHAENLEDWVYTSQLNQRDAVRFAIEHYRSNPACRGALIWQVNDCWPVQSWALEDYARQLKPAGMEIERLFAPVLICAQVEGANLKIAVCNDSQARVEERLTVTFFDTVALTTQTENTVGLVLDPDERKTAAEYPLQGFPTNRTACRIELSGHPGATRWLLLGEPKHAELGSPQIGSDWDGDDFRVRVTGFVQDLQLVSLAGSEIIDSESGLPGTRSYTGINLSISWRIIGPKQGLVLRSIAGVYARM